MSLSTGRELLRFAADNAELLELLAEALANGLSREQAVQAIKAAMTAAGREQLLRELGP